MPVDLDLIPEYKKWDGLNPEHPRYMLYYHLNIVTFASIIEILDPEVDFVDGKYILRLAFLMRDNYLAYEDSGLSLSEVESRVNRFSVRDLLQHDSTLEEAGAEILYWIALQIKKYWEFNLSLKYPEVKFVIKILYGDIDPEISLFTER